MIDPQQYRTAREQRGSRKDVAAALGVHPITLAKRETGAMPITQEAWLAMLALPIQRTGTHQ